VNHFSKPTRVVVPLGLLSLVLVGCSGADPGEGTVDPQQAVVDAIMYEGEDREAFLYECAQEEGSLVWYTSSSAVEGSLAPAFMETYPGIQVEVFKETTALSQIVLEEANAGINRMDLFVDIHGNLVRSGLIFAPLNPVVTEPVREELKSEYEVATNGFIMGAAYNTDLVAPEDAPTSYEDLADPKWAGLLAAGLDTTTPFTFGIALEAHGAELLEALAANARVQDGVSSAGVRDLIVAGEFPVGWGVSSSYQKRNAIDDGAPFQWVPLSPMFANFSTASISKNAPHPCAATLALDWLLSTDGGYALLIEGEGGASPFADQPILPFDILGQDQSEWDVVYGTDPATYQDAGFASCEEAALTWNEEFRDMFLR